MEDQRGIRLTNGPKMANRQPTLRPSLPGVTNKAAMMGLLDATPYNV